MPPPKTKELRELQKIWYQKLKETGFDDIEDVNSPREYLKTWHASHFLKARTPETFQLQQEYYRRASLFLHSHRFQNKTEKLIWTYHTEGISQRDIANALKAEGFKVNSVSVHKDDVNKVICKLAKQMKNQREALMTLDSEDEPKPNKSEKNLSLDSLMMIRPYDPYGDEALIYSTWLSSLYFGDSWFSLIERKAFFPYYRKVLQHLLKRPQVQIQIACLREDPGVILGYSVSEGSILHYIFVKAVWREIGLAKRLLPTSIQSVTHITKIGKSILSRKFPARHKDEWIDETRIRFNPFLI